MNDDQRALASAALDGAVTTEERARADADPEIAAEMERLGDVRDALRVADAPDPDRREAVIAAALAAFDSAEPSLAPPRLDDHRRARWMAPAAAAAAVAVLAVGAVVAVQRDGTDDDSAATVDVEMAEATIAASGRDQSDEAPAASAVPDAGGDSADTAAPVAAPEATERAASAESEELDAVVETLRSTADLASFALRSSGPAPLSETARCSNGTFVGSALYESNGAAILVEVFVTVSGDEAVAVDQATCEDVARTPLP